MPKGLIAFPITPMDADGRVEAEAFGRLLRRLVEAKVDAVCVLGSTGTYAYMSRDERRRALEIAASEINGALPLMAGIGALRTDHAVQHAKDAAAAGATLGLLAPMSYTPLTDDEVFAHFQAVAADGGLPVCVYDNPASTHFPISDPLMGRVMAVPNVVASKSAAPPASEVADRLAALRARSPSGFSVGFAVDWNATEALIAGADAWYSVLGGLFPTPLVNIRCALARGDIEEARRLNSELQPLWDLMRRHSGLRVMYALANLTVLTLAAPPRPILPLGPEVRDQIVKVLEQLAPIL